MKQQDARIVKVGENTFYIRPLPALRAANLSGELAALAVPLLSGLAPILAAADGKGKGSEGSGLLDVDITDAAPAIAGAFSTLSGDKVEAILRHLLVTGGNIAIETEDGAAKVLSEDLLNETFCTDVQDMFILAFEVIRTNYNGFFKKLGGRFGQAIEGLMQKATPRPGNTEPST